MLTWPASFALFPLFVKSLHKSSTPQTFAKESSTENNWNCPHFEKTIAETKRISSTFFSQTLIFHYF